MISRIDILGIKGTPIRVINVPKGEHCPNHPNMNDPSGYVEFYDLRYITRTIASPESDGQFITRYTTDVYLGGWPVGSSPYSQGHGLDLYGSEPDWKIDGRAQRIIGDWISYLNHKQRGGR